MGEVRNTFTVQRRFLCRLVAAAVKLEEFFTLFAIFVLFFPPLISGYGQAAVKGLSEPEARAKAARLATLFRPAEFRAPDGVHIPYRYFEPSAQATAANDVPVILYLHGEDEAGTDNTAQVSRTECATVWVEPDHLAENPAYVLAPQLPRGVRWTDEAVATRTLDLLQQFLKTHPRADRNRLYLVGFSMGGDGVYKLLLEHPRMFAAAMPISGSADSYLARTDAWAALKHTPVIIIHSYDDRMVHVSAAQNAAAALQNGGNTFLGYGAPTPSLWSPGSSLTPHDAWYTAFEKFEVIYNSLFLGDLAKTHNGELDITETYQSRKLGDGITQVWDYALGTCMVIERADKAVLVDATMGHGSIYRYIRDHVLVNKDVPIEVVVTHFHQDHTFGLKSFIGSSQLKKVYAGTPDDQVVRQVLGPDAAKVTPAKDGDTFALGGGTATIIAVPGHTAGSIVLQYGNYLFTGDSIGTGYVGVSTVSIQQYVGSVQHLLDRMGPGHFTVYGGHTGELRGAMTEQYVRDLLACAQGIVDGSVPAAIYWRNRDSAIRKVSTVGGASITYAIANIRTIPAALGSLRLSQGVVYPAFSPEFAPTTANPPGFAPSIDFYKAWVGADTASVVITAAALDPQGSRVTVNGSDILAGQSYIAKLAGERTTVSIVVTASDGATRSYTLTLIRSAIP